MRQQRVAAIGIAGLCGGSEDRCLALSGIGLVIAGTEVETKRMQQEVNEVADIGSSLPRVCQRFDGYDYSHIPLDHVLTAGPVPPPCRRCFAPRYTHDGREGFSDR